MKIILIVSIVFLALPVDAQMKVWTDENGVTHYESSGTGTSSQRTPSVQDRRSTQPISRTHNGLTLGDYVSTLRSSKSAVEANKDASGAEVFAILPSYLPKGAKRMLAVYMDGRLSVITTDYKSDAFESWDKLISATTAKYGEPITGDRDTKRWSDGQVVLVLKKDYLDSITATIAFLDSLQKYYKAVGATSPQF